MAMGKSFRLSQKFTPPNLYSVLLEQRHSEDSLLFESQAVAVLTSGEAETIKRQYTKIIDAYGCLGVLQVNAGDKRILYLVLVTGCTSVGKIGDTDVFRITNTVFLSLRNVASDEERIVEVRKVINSGTFYFSWSSTSKEPFDLTLCAQKRLKTNKTDNRFFWNRMLHIHFVRFGVDCGHWLLKAMCGNVEMRTVYVGHHQARACIISRLSGERVGTRFNVRGCNDDGHVANFVETEQVIFLDDLVTSFIQTRGSVPLFWEQPGVQVGSHKVKMSRGVEVSLPAFDRHLTLIKKRYGKQVLVNLLGNKEGETFLSQMFQLCHKESKRHVDVPYVHFDYHAHYRGKPENLLILRSKLANYLGEFGIFLANGSEVVMEQIGTLRINCLDCLDRTNAIQTMLGLEMLSKQLQLLCVIDKPQVSRFEEVFRQMWVNNGDQVSKMYAGTGALEGKSKLIDGARSVSRTIQNNLLDSSKQEAIDILLLGSTLINELQDRARLLLSTNMLHAPSNVLQTMCSRLPEYTTPFPIRIAVATWNVNGGKNVHNVAFKHQTLKDWLLDIPKQHRANALVDLSSREDNTPVDIFAIGFEEIVDLNASNIMAASTTNQRIWKQEIMRTINIEHQYVPVSSIQLVGVCLFIFVRPFLAPFIRDVAVDTVKTGFGGATGNKGAVAFRMVLFSTSMCFVCAHFAAGQSQYVERNADYLEICKKVSFPMGRTLNSHDYIFWCGDFNYRIDLPLEEVKEAIKQNNVTYLLQFDQLRAQQKVGQIFHDFIEGDINFPPTYKYDIFSDDYDTSEKSRVPAWTDRVLYQRKRYFDKGFNPGKIAYYARAELKTSDHRPVIGIFDVEVLKVNKARRQEVFGAVVQSLGPPDGTVIVQYQAEVSNDTTLQFDDNFVSEVLQLFATIGEVTFVRFIGGAMWVTFRDGLCALQALRHDNSQIRGQTISITLKTPDWLGAFEEEVQLCNDNIVSLYELDDLDDCDDEVLRGDETDFVSVGGFSEDRNFTGDFAPGYDSLPSSGRASPVVPTVDSETNCITGLSGAYSSVQSVPPDLDLQSLGKAPVQLRPAPPPPQRPPPPRSNKDTTSSDRATETVIQVALTQRYINLTTDEIVVQSSAPIDEQFKTNSLLSRNDQYSSNSMLPNAVSSQTEEIPTQERTSPPLPIIAPPAPLIPIAPPRRLPPLCPPALPPRPTAASSQIYSGEEPTYEYKPPPAFQPPQAPSRQIPSYSEVVPPPLPARPMPQVGGPPIPERVTQPPLHTPPVIPPRRNAP